MRETFLPSKTWTLILCILEGYYCFANNDKQEKMISSTMPTAAAVINTSKDVDMDRLLDNNKILEGPNNLDKAKSEQKKKHKRILAVAN